jgi:hypothetical protein
MLKSRLALWPGVTAFRRWRRPRQADIHLLSYPKTGRTWVRVMMGRMLAEHFDQQVGAAVDHLRVLDEVGSRIHHPEQLHDPLDAIETSDLVPQHGKEVEGCDTGMVGCFLGRDVRSHLARRNPTVGRHRPGARQIDEVSGSHGIHEARRGRANGWQLESQLLDAQLDRHGYIPIAWYPAST